MKNSTKLASAALVAAVAFGALAPQAVKAAEGNSLTGKGKIEFTSTSSQTTNPTNPSGGSNGGSGELPTDGSEGTTTSVGPFGVSYVTNLDFDKHTIVTTAAADEVYWANTWVGNKGTANEMKNANFIKFTDTRSTLDHSYSIGAKITKPFTATVGTGTQTDVTLQGTTITYTNPNIVPDEGTVASLAPTASASAEISTEATTTVIANTNTANAAQYTKGYGNWTLLWGQYSAGADDTSAKSIQLTIPRNATENAIVQEGAYTAEITWSMSDVPLG